MESELKPGPNPWCEAAERDGDFSPLAHRVQFGNWLVSCSSCCMRGPTKATEAEAIAAWNQRPTPPADKPAQSGGYSAYSAPKSVVDAAANAIAANRALTERLRVAEEENERFRDALLNINGAVDTIDGAQDIARSDISICANNILGCYYNHPSEASDEEFYIVRNSVNHALSNLEYIRQNY